MGAMRQSRKGGLESVSERLHFPLLLAELVIVYLTIALALIAAPAWAETRTGTIGNGCSYTLDDSGKLTIYPTDGVSGEMARVRVQSDMYVPGSSIDYDAVKSISIQRGVRTPKNTTGLFSNLPNMVSANLSGLDTSQATNMMGMFQGCSSLSSLDLSGFNTSQVTDMGRMFEGCASLSTLDLSDWDTSSGCSPYAPRSRLLPSPAGTPRW